MKRKMQGLLWLFLLEYALMVMSLEPGFLDFDNLPDTNFSCVGKVIGGYYADLETNCQMFHVCTIGQLDEPMDIRFLCLNGTVFDQETRVCERIDEVDCSKSEQFYSLNLELYGNTQPPILEESPEIEYPLDSKKTTTSPPPSTSTSTFAPFFPPSSPTTNHDISKVITSHHFPVNAPDIRFNPEEINISLKPGAPPDITRSQVPISYQQQSFSEKNTRVTVTTHTTIYKNEKHRRPPILSTTNPPLQSLTEKPETTLTPKSVVSYGLTHNQGPVANPTEINYGFSYPQTDESVEYHTVPPHPYQYQLSINNFRPPSAQNHPYHSSYRNANKRQQKNNYPATTYRNHPAFTSPKAPQYAQHTEKPPNLQLPIPLLPTLPPISFSSPSPFSLDHHIETKRYTKDHQSPPRIIISASASVSDNNGRRLNYSLGQIGASHFLGSSPSSYDDYKEEDVILDPFYHDVPKLKKSRNKRSVLDNDDVIRNDQEAEDLLRYLFNWYKNKQKSKHITIPVPAEDITDINYQLAPVSDAEASSTSKFSYEQFFRDILRENYTEGNASRDSSISRKDENENFTVTATITTHSTKLNRNTTEKSTTESQQVQSFNITDDAHVHSHREIHLPLITKNHTRRSEIIVTTEEYQNVDYFNNYPDNFEQPNENYDQFNEHLNSETELQKDTYDYLDETLNNENATVLQNLFYDDLSSQNRSDDEHYEHQQNLTDAFTTNVVTPSTTENIKEVLSTLPDYDYSNTTNRNYDYFNPTLLTNATEELAQSVTTDSIVNASDYFDVYDNENLYEDLALETTTLPVTTDSIPTASNADNNTTTAKLDLEMLETQSHSQEKWDKVSSAKTNTLLSQYEGKNSDKLESSLKEDISIKTIPEKTRVDKQFSVFSIPDYVDDNYEPQTYQINAHENKSVELTTEIKFDSLTTNFNEMETSTELERLIYIDTPENTTDSLVTTETVMSEFPTVETTELTTDPATTLSTETTIVTEGVFETSTEHSDQTTTGFVETTPVFSTNTFPTTPTVLETTTITEDILTTKISTTPRYSRNEKLKRKEYPRHRFSSSNRSRGRERSKFQPQTVLNTVNISRNKKITQKPPRLTTVMDDTLNLTELFPFEASKMPISKADDNTEIMLTDAPLLKSANPTKAKYSRVVLSTTPLTKVVRIELRKDFYHRRYTFNCFNKKIHHFYSDPRDCRLFHYCTLGFTKNQLVDMKFVCDLGTYYDEEKFICTTEKPARCQ